MCLFSQILVAGAGGAGKVLAGVRVLLKPGRVEGFYPQLWFLGFVFGLDNFTN